MGSTLERWLDGTQTQLYTRSCGQGWPLICVHGGPGAGHTYLTDSLTLLSDTCRTIFYDQRGVGRSLAGTAISFTQHLADLDLIVQSYTTDRVFLLGHSWGAVLALAYASWAPQRRTAALVLVNAVSPASIERWAFAEQTASRLDCKEFETYCQKLSTSQHLGSVSWRDRLAFAHATWGLFYRKERAQLLPYFPQPGLESEPLWEEATRILSTPPRSRLPILVVHGDYDPTPLEVVMSVASRFSSVLESVCLSACGHIAPLEAPEALSAAVRSFVLRELALGHSHASSKPTS